MNRRSFLKMVGMGSISLAAGCTPDPHGQPHPRKHLFSLVNAPDDMVTGQAAWYASTCRECPAGCGILAKNREGRVIKVEGNPLHPINRGKLCLRGQAAPQGVYNPDRITTPQLRKDGRWHGISFAEAATRLRQKARAAAAAGPGRVRMVTETVGGVQFDLFRDVLAHWRSEAPLVFEPLAYEALKAANRAALGIDGLPSYRIQDADVLVSFGADFLETWLSPVQYARRFSRMHGLHDGRKGFFAHVGPYRSLTGANADQWVACRPGGEVVIALGLVRELLAAGRTLPLAAGHRAAVERAAAACTREAVAEQAAVPPPHFERLLARLAAAKRPLVLGTGTGPAGPNAPAANLAANYLNLLLDPELPLIDTDHRHRVEMAAGRDEMTALLNALGDDGPGVLLLNNVNPVHGLPPDSGAAAALGDTRCFVVAFTNFMDDTAQRADLLFPTRLPLESWDEYAGVGGIVSTLQPALGRLTGAPSLGGVLLEAAFGDSAAADTYKAHLLSELIARRIVTDEFGWLCTLQDGGRFEASARTPPAARPAAGGDAPAAHAALETLEPPPASGTVFLAVPSLRHFDGRGANRPWLSEVPDPLTRVAWQTPLLAHSDDLAAQGLRTGDRVRVTSRWGAIDAPVCASTHVRPGVCVMSMGQGHGAFGRYAAGQGANPLHLLPAGGRGAAAGTVQVTLRRTGRGPLARTAGSTSQYGRKIAMTVALDRLPQLAQAKHHGLAMHDFPLTLPLPEGYDAARDFYPPIEYAAYRWAMTVDLDRCIGCGACAVACYAENNIGVVGEARIAEGREMAWLSVACYQAQGDTDQPVFLPLMCQHCDNAPCEAVCPVYAPHHNQEGMNNQIYNRCIGTRFCSQNCPYKVRRFNWYDWPWPDPLPQLLNPNVTVRAKGVMEKCSFCVQRIKEAHGWAKNDNRPIRDGEVVPACVQTCPTGALTFGNLMDPESRVRRLADDPRAYQVMGYLNTKPAVIYLKKVLPAV